jgi:hypothetical protein
MRTLFLAWQSEKSRAWYPVGRLDADIAQKEFVFEYTRGALAAKKRDGFLPISAFPKFNERYESSELFPLFQNRIIDSHRRGFVDYVRSLDMNAESVDPLDILAVTGGERQTDSFEVFPKIEKDKNNGFVCRFFLHGLRYGSQEAQARALALKPGEKLRVSQEFNGPTQNLALRLTTLNDHVSLGWAPRYLVPDLLPAVGNSNQLSAVVIRNNELGMPLNRRILIELSGTLPAEYVPMRGENFEVISELVTH